MKQTHNKHPEKPVQLQLVLIFLPEAEKVQNLVAGILPCWNLLGSEGALEILRSGIEPMPKAQEEELRKQIAEEFENLVHSTWEQQQERRKKADTKSWAPRLWDKITMPTVPDNKALQQILANIRQVPEKPFNREAHLDWCCHHPE